MHVDSKLNVLVIAQYFPPDLGGSATRAYNLAKGLAVNGCTVTVVAAFPHYPHGKIPKDYKWKPLKVEWMSQIKVIRTFMPPIKSVGFFKRLLLLGSFAVSSLFALPFVGRVDAVWASSWVPGLAYSRLKKRPLALNMDDLKIEDLVDLGLLVEGSLFVRIAECVYRLFLVKADVVTPVSPAYAETLSKKYCVKPNRIHLVRGGVDLSIFKPNASKSEFGKKFTVLYSGAFSVAYDFEQIFKAAKIVEGLDSDVEFVIQGKGELLGSMCSKVDALKVKNVRIIDKLLSREAVGELLDQADALILPLVEFKKPYRGMSSKLYEYQAVGKPIICCSRGLPRDYVQNTGSGLVVYPGDYEALAKAVLELKENFAATQMMGENGRKYVEHEASIEAIGSRMKEILEAQLCIVA
jgi:glycosyltransferase involved in cell wall biosynthesis